jgi:MFS transporter, DHA3 family, macrolide efflux protein
MLCIKQGRPRAALLLFFLPKEGMMTNSTHPKGKRVFGIVWFGQLISVLGSALTAFALGLRVYLETGSVTQFALLSLCNVLPVILLAPLAGALVDRWDRRWTMILSDTGAALCTLGLAALLVTHRLEVWHIYLAAALSALAGTFQTPAYLAASTLLVSPKDLGRVGGLMQLGQAAAEILAPMLAGFLVLKIQLYGVILIDFATFLFAVGTLLVVRFPRPEVIPSTGAGRAARPARSLRREMAEGFAYLRGQPGLQALLVYFAVVNFFGGMIGVLAQPMILSYASADVLGVLLTIAGGGFLLGSLVMSAWGGPKRRVDGILGFGLLFGLGLCTLGFRPAALWVGLGAFVAHFALPFVNGCNQAIWQSRVPPALQGRVFALRQTVAKSAQPLAIIIAGPLADRVFGPLLTPGNFWADRVGGLIGFGPGRGIGLLFIAIGVLVLATMLAGYIQPRLQAVEKVV